MVRDTRTQIEYQLFVRWRARALQSPLQGTG